MPNAAFFGLDLSAEALDGALEEERASCVVAKRVSAGRMRAAGCFAQVANPMPPPPPPSEDAAASARLAAWAERLNNNVVNGTYETPTPSDEQQWLDKTAGARAGTQAIIDSLRDANPVLRGILQDTLEELASAGAGAAQPVQAATNMDRATAAGYNEGRRLLQREAQRLHVEDLLVTHPVMATSGMAGIPGITSGACEALCEALRMKEVTSADGGVQGLCLQALAPL